MSNKTLLYTSSLVPIFWIFFYDWHILQAEVYFHLQSAPKQPRRLPGLSLSPSHLIAFLKISNQVLSCQYPESRSHLATTLDTCKEWPLSCPFCCILSLRHQIQYILSVPAWKEAKYTFLTLSWSQFLCPLGLCLPLWSVLPKFSSFHGFC